MANSKLNKLTKNGITYDLQDKEISDKLANVNGIIKDNAGTLTTAVEGIDYGYPLLKGAGAPSTSTVASVGQHYFDTSAVKDPYEYVCVAAGSTYTWAEAGSSGAGSGLIADEYSASSAYVIGDVVIYEDGLYKCNTTISSGEAWNASHWTATTVDGLISELQAAKADLDGLISELQATKADLDGNGKVPYSQLPEITAVKTYYATIGTTWVENDDTGVRSQNIAIDGITATHTAKVDHAYTGDGTSDSYAAFVEAENQYLTYITNGYAETYDGGVRFNIFGDAPTVEIPVVVEVA